MVHLDGNNNIRNFMINSTSNKLENKKSTNFI